MHKNCKAPTAAFVLVGDEILSGKIQDCNGPLLAKKLREIGVDLCRIITIGDSIEEIAWAINCVCADHTHVFTSGGIGPTHDDVTINGVAAAFDVEVVEDPELVKILKSKKGYHVTPAHLRMARVPQGTVLQYGGRFRFPLLRFRHLFIMPGVPEAFEDRLEVCLPLLSGIPVHTVWVSLTVDEGYLADSFEAILAAHPSVTIGSYPEWKGGQYKVRVAVESRNSADAQRAAEELIRQAGLIEVK